MTSQIKKLQKKLKSAGDLREEVDTLNELSILVVDDDAAKSLEYSKKAHELAETIKYSDGIAYAIYNHGMYLWREGDYVAALKRLSDSVDHLSGEDLELRARIYTGFGIIYYTSGNYDLALSWYLKALEDMEITDLTERKSVCLHNIGMIYTELAEYKTAIDYILRSVNMLGEDIETTQDAHILDSFSDLLRRMGHLDEALYCATRSLELSTADNNLTLSASTNSNLANIYAAKDEWEEAESHASESVRLWSEVDDKRGLASCYSEWAANLITHEAYEEALKYLDKAEQITDETVSKPVIMDIYKRRSDALIALGKHQEALTSFKKFHEIKEMVLTKGMLEHINALNAEYLADKTRREAEIHRLKNIELARAQTIARLGNWEWYSLTGELTGSAEFYRIIDLQPSEKRLSLNDICRCFHEKDRHKFDEIFKSFSSSTKDDSTLLNIRCSDGDERIVRMQWSVHQDSVTAAGFVIVGTLQDVTELERAKEALQQSEERYRTVVEQSADCIFLIDLSNGALIQANRSLQELLGYSDVELKALTIYDFVAHPKRDINQKIKETRKNGQLLIGERQYRHKNKSLIDVEVMVSLIRSSGNDVMCVISRDITRRKQAEQELRHEKEFISNIIETSPAYIVVINNDGAVGMMNRSMQDALGYEESEVIGKDYIETFVPSFEWDELRAELKRLKKTGESNPSENYVLRWDGRPLRVEWRGVPIYDDKNNYLYYCGIGIDVTQRKRAEDRLNALIDNAPDVFLYQSGTGERYISANIEKVMGYKPEELTATEGYFGSLIHPDDEERARSAHDAWIKAGAEGTLETELRARCKDGKYIWLLDRMTCVSKSTDQKYQFFGVMTNITRLKQVEAERESLIEELQVAISKIKALSGLIPICSGCKKIRDDSGFWNQLEEYISEHSDTVFSHGLCPDCARELYPEVFDQNKGESGGKSHDHDHSHDD